MELVNPGIGLIFWSTLTFIILLVLLRRFAWKPILGAVKSREESIKAQLAAAEAARKEMQNINADNERILKEARAEREVLLKEAREIKEKIIADAKGAAQGEADKMIKQAKAAIKSERQAAVTELKNQVATLSVAIAEKVMKGELSDKQKQLKMVDNLLEDVTLN